MDKVEKYAEELNKIFKKYAVEFAYLYGSQATGHTNRESDFDFSVMLPAYLDSDARFEIRLKLISEISRVLKTDEIDLNILNDLRSILLKFVIIKEGILIFNQNPEARMDFELKTMNEYYDYKPFLEAYNKAYIERQLKK